MVLGIMVVMLLMFLMSISLGFAFATLSTDIVQSFAFTRLLSLLFTTLAPVYYPTTLNPDSVALSGLPVPDHLRCRDRA